MSPEAAQGGPAQRPVPRSGDPFSDIVARAIDGRACSGAVLRVERNGDCLFHEAWGDAIRAGATVVPMNPDTIFDAASLTKLFTTTAILRLATTGSLSLDTRLEALLPALADRFGIDAALRSRLAASVGAVDVAALLSHSSGIRAWYPFYARRGESFETILADVLEKNPRRTVTLYSDINFMILGRLVEAVTGAHFATAMGDLVLSPLGLDRTSWKAPLGPVAATEFGNRIEEGMVADIGLSFDGWRDREAPIFGEPNDGNCHYFFGGVAGHAGLFSDARDLCRLGRLYVDRGAIDGAGWIEPGLATEATMDRGAGRGLGFQTGDLYPGGGCGHTGFTGTYLYVKADAGLVVAFLANRLHVEAPGDINPLRREVAALALSLL